MFIELTNHHPDKAKLLIAIDDISYIYQEKDGTSKVIFKREGDSYYNVEESYENIKERILNATLESGSDV